jgi:hypothetical protein
MLPAGVLVLVLSGALVLAGCGSGGDLTAKKQTGSPTSSVTSRSSPSASPTATMIGGQLVNLAEAASIEQAVRDYFAALGDGDFDRMRELSTGELRSLAGWLETLDSAYQDLGVLRAIKATLEDLELVSVAGDQATVTISGTLNESYFDEKRSNTKDLDTDISGTVILTGASPWRVADFQREGRSVREALHARVRGSKTSNGMAVTIKGVDVRPSGTAVIMSLRNTSGLTAGANAPKLVGPSGKEFRTTFRGNVQYLEVRGRSQKMTGFFFPKGLPSTAKTFRFVMFVYLGCDPVCNATASFDFPVTLAA